MDLENKISVKRIKLTEHEVGLQPETWPIQCEGYPGIFQQNIAKLLPWQGRLWKKVNKIFLMMNVRNVFKVKNNINFKLTTMYWTWILTK